MKNSMSRCVGGVCLPWQLVRYKGHSQYQNRMWQRKHAYEKRAKIFGKLSLEIMRAVKAKGPDPKLNPTLEVLRNRARHAGMPKENVENAIKKAQRAGNEEDIERNVIIQARGPGKSHLIIDVVTANVARCRGEIRRILKRNQASYVDDNTNVNSNLFDQKGVLTIDSVSENGLVLAEDDALELAIVIGAEYVFSDIVGDNQNTIFHFICPPLELGMLEKSLYAHEDCTGLKILSSDTQFIPKLLVNVADEMLEQNVTLLEMLDDYPDVVGVFDNIKHFPSRTIKHSSLLDK